MTIKVYAGLSLAEADVLNVLPDCEVAGPVKRDDLLADIEAGIAVIVLIDGKFQQSLAVSAAEILDALRSGVRVYGASSMGALRAAELHPYGMTGHGAIYEMIVSQRWFRDDLLGQTFFEPSLESASVPYVNVHFGLRELQAQGVVSPAEQALLDEICKGIHFSRRDRSTVAQAIEAQDPERKDALIAAVTEALAHDQKRLDALGLLERVKADLDRTAELNWQILSSQRESTYHDQLDPAVEMNVGILLGP
jgi:hypothetical protein